MRTKAAKYDYPVATKNPERDSYFPAIEAKHGRPMSYWFKQMRKISDFKYAEQIAFLRKEHGFSQTHANALVLYCRGSKSSSRYGSVANYLAQFDETKRKTVTWIFKAITDKYPKMELVLAWNQPMLKMESKYILGLSVHNHHILIAPCSAEVLEEFKSRLVAYEMNKKTFKVPVDWEVDSKLLQDLAAARLAE